jgi:hypothetical protein
MNLYNKNTKCKYVNMQIDNVKLLPKTIVVNSKISKIDGFGKNILEKLQENQNNIYIGGTAGGYYDYRYPNCLVAAGRTGGSGSRPQ